MMVLFGVWPTAYPWPCFVIAATDRFLSEEPSAAQHILEVINEYTLEFKQIPSIDRTLANEYGQQLEDIKEWLSNTRWSQNQLSSASLTKVQETLHSLGLIKSILPEEQILKNF